MQVLHTTPPSHFKPVRNSSHKNQSETFHQPHDATARNRELKMRFQGAQHQKESKLDTHWAVSPGDTLTLLVRRMKETLSQRLC